MLFRSVGVRLGLPLSPTGGCLLGLASVDNRQARDVSVGLDRGVAGCLTRCCTAARGALRGRCAGPPGPVCREPDRARYKPPGPPSGGAPRAAGDTGGAGMARPPHGGARRTLPGPETGLTTRSARPPARGHGGTLESEVLPSHGTEDRSGGQRLERARAPCAPPSRPTTVAGRAVTNPHDSTPRSPPATLLGPRVGAAGARWQGPRPR